MTQMKAMRKPGRMVERLREGPASKGFFEGLELAALDVDELDTEGSSEDDSEGDASAPLAVRETGTLEEVAVMEVEKKVR